MHPELELEFFGVLIIRTREAAHTQKHRQDSHFYSHNDKVE
jgi:hypothetical protein